MKSRFEFTVEEIRGTSSAVEAGHDPQSSLDEKQEKGVDNVDQEQSVIETRRSASQLHNEKHTEEKLEGKFARSQG